VEVGGRQGKRYSEVSEVDELNAINDVYLWEIESLYTWKTLVPERLRSVLYLSTMSSNIAYVSVI